MTFDPPREVAPGVVLVDTRYVRPRLAASYLVRGKDSAAVVETGSATAVPGILAAIAAQGLRREDVSHVIVTHVHLDHAGGAGALVRELPRARLVAHPRGARHLVDPSKLVAGTVEVYGEARFRELYGELVPVPAERVDEAPEGFTVDLGGRRLRVLDAPGHARHHFVVLDETTRGFFTGDSFGLSYRDTDGPPARSCSRRRRRCSSTRRRSTAPSTACSRSGPSACTSRTTARSSVAGFRAALHRGLDEHVRRARTAPAGPGRHAALRASLEAQLLEDLARHGAPIARADALRVFEGDLELNAQGLEVWLDTQKKG